jgi:hypothetical protein
MLRTEEHAHLDSPARGPRPEHPVLHSGDGLSFPRPVYAERSKPGRPATGLKESRGGSSAPCGGRKDDAVSTHLAHAFEQTERRECADVRARGDGPHLGGKLLWICGTRRHGEPSRVASQPRRLQSCRISRRRSRGQREHEKRQDHGPCETSPHAYLDDRGVAASREDVFSTASRWSSCPSLCCLQPPEQGLACGIDQRSIVGLDHLHARTVRSSNSNSRFQQSGSTRTSQAGSSGCSRPWTARHRRARLQRTTAFSTVQLRGDAPAITPPQSG